MEAATLKDTEFAGRIEDILHLLQKKDDKIRHLHDELTAAKEYGSSPERNSPKGTTIRRLIDMSGDRTSARDIKNGVLIENALQIQANTLYTLKQVVSELKNHLITHLSKSKNYILIV